MLISATDDGRREREKSNKEKGLCIVYVSDDNYARITGISIYSLLKNNDEFTYIKIYVVDNGINVENKKNIEKICKLFRRDIEFKNAIDLTSKFHLPETNLKNYTVYNNLFFASLLEEEKALYIDSDTVICDSLKDLWNVDMEGYYIAAAKDTYGFLEAKIEAGIAYRGNYYNTGVVLYNLKLWREENVENQCVSAIEYGPQKSCFRSQRVLNEVCKSKVRTIDVKYNVLSLYYDLKEKDVIWFAEMNEFYSPMEIKEAKGNPVIIHYAGSNRPWEAGCSHARKDIFLKFEKEANWTGILKKRDYPVNTKIRIKLKRFLPYMLYVGLKKINRIRKNYAFKIRNSDNVLCKTYRLW